MRSSKLNISGNKADLVVNLLKHVGATDYYSAAGSAGYLEESRHLFDDANIRYRYQTWEHPHYTQGSGDFTSHLAILDAISWIGFQAVAALLSPQSSSQSQ